jgi:hypothetical protein
MRKVIIAITVGLGLMLCVPSTAFAKSKTRRHHARSVKHAKAKTSKRVKRADNDKQLMTPHFS